MDKDILISALEAHNHNGWYSAILHSALEHTKDPSKAVHIADELFEQHKVDTSSPQEDDAKALFDSSGQNGTPPRTV